ncbi:MAG: hypothetical protein JSV49_03310 [Thermoplasmata archaeon]|nr:MAG: hypothetical protein JSV49_03310 [Thermoplasmata archaeon]
MGFFRPDPWRMFEKRDMHGVAKAMTHKDVKVRRGATACFKSRTIKEIDKDELKVVIHPLIERLRDPDKAVRGYATQALAHIHLLHGLVNKTATSDIVQLLFDPDAEIRADVVYGLGEIFTNPIVVSAESKPCPEKGSENVVFPIIEKLKDSDDRVKEAAAVTLGSLGYEEAVMPLIELLHKSGNKTVTKATIQSLNMINPDWKDISAIKSTERRKKRK